MLEKLIPLSFFIGSRLCPKQSARRALYLFGRPQKIARPPSEMGYFESAKKYFLKCGFAAYEWGNPTDPVVLLIHGWNGRGTQMGAFAEPLVKNNFRVIALDGPAHGSSPGTETDPHSYANFIVLSAYELGPVHTVIAHSLGAGCSAMALQRGMHIKKLVYIAGPSLYERIANAFVRIIRLSPKAKNYFFDLLTQRVGIKPHDLYIAKMKTEIPALVIHDENDLQIPYSEAIEIAEAWPQAQLLLTKGLGHRRVLRDKAVLDKVLSFILQ